jgi:hypothetical protein
MGHMHVPAAENIVLDNKKKKKPYKYNDIPSEPENPQYSFETRLKNVSLASLNIQIVF